MMKKTKVVARKKKVTSSTISAARKKVMTKKPLRKMAAGGKSGPCPVGYHQESSGGPCVKDKTKTPFQSYMTTKGATAADTSATTPYKANVVTKNNPLLKKAYELTYGQDFGSSDVANPHGSFATRRGDNSGYKDMTTAQRAAYEKEVAKNKKLKRGGKVTKMKGGGMLKSVNPMSNPGLSKLPTEVRNKMGYKKKGGKVGTTKKK